MTRRVSAAGLTVETTLTNPQRRFLAVGLMVETIPGAIPPDRVYGITECAPEVDSVHRGQALVVDNAGPEVLSIPADDTHIPAAGIQQTQTVIEEYQPSKFSAQGLTISVFRPKIVPGVSYDPEFLFLQSVQKVVSGWSQTISVDGGYVSAQWTIDVDRVELDDWFENGLMRHVAVYDSAGVRIWEGFVNQIDVTTGGNTITRGPVMDIANRLKVYYSRLDMTLETPVVYPTAPGLLADNTESQELYGIMEETLSGGTCTDLEADYYRDTYLYENGFPQNSKSISLGGGNMSINVSLLGYSALFKKYLYEMNSILFTTARDKLIAVIGANPNLIYSNNYSYIGENATILPEGVPDDGKTAENVIKSIVELGDANNIPWTFGVYAFRQIYYQPEETGYTYYQRMGDPMQKIRTAGGSWVRPWNVMPGKWLFIDDLLAASPRKSPRTEQRATYIEEVTYTAPWGLQLRGSGGGRRLKQFLARLAQEGRG